MDTLEQIHIKIHALRLLRGYKPTPFESDIAKMICKEFQTECEECKTRLRLFETAPSEDKKNGGIMNSVFDFFGG